MNTDCVKKVTFSSDTKKHDGQLEKNILFPKMILDYFNGIIKNEFDIYKIIREKKYLIFELFAESLIILLKLNKIKNEEDIHTIIRPYLSLNKPYEPKDHEDFHLFREWDIPEYNRAAYKKNNAPKAVSIARQGSRIYSEKLTTSNIHHLIKFSKILFQTCDLVLKKSIQG